MIAAKNSEIHEAIATGDLKKLQTWVESGNQFKRKWFDLTDGNNNALRLAARFGQFSVVKWLVEECKQQIYSEAKSNKYINKAAKFETHPTSPKQTQTGYITVFSAIMVSVVQRQFSITKWLLESRSVNVEEELRLIRQAISIYYTLPEVTYEKQQVLLEFFKWFFAYTVKNKVCMGEYLMNPAPYVPIDYIKWIVRDSGLSKPLTLKSVLAILEKAEEALNPQKQSSLAVWLIEESNQVVDCREYGEDTNDIWFGNEDVHEYLKAVKQQQDFTGLERWYEGKLAKKAIDAKQKSRL